VSKDPQTQQQAVVYMTRPWAIVVKPRAVNLMNGYLALYHAGMWDDDTLNQALGEEISRGAMLTSWESVEVQPTGKISGRCVEFTMPGTGREGLWWAEDIDIVLESGI
jgi:hypothetical protein